MPSCPAVIDLMKKYPDCKYIEMDTENIEEKKNTEFSELNFLRNVRSIFSDWMRRKEFLENVAVPLLGIAVVMFIVYLFCVENGVCDYRKLWIVSGIPFGIQKMYFWMIPKGFDIGGTVGMFAFNLLIGGMIGSVVLTWRLLMVGTYLLKSIGYGGLWIVRKAFRT